MAFLKKYCTAIETVMLDFLWSSKKHRVSRNTLKRPNTHGRFNLYSVRDIELVLNVKLIYTLSNANVEVWNLVGKQYLQNLDSKYNIRYSLCTCSFLPNMNYSSVMSTFYVQALRNWSFFLQSFVPTTTTELLNKSLFLNALFVIKRRPIVVNSFILSKLLLLRDIWDNERNDFITSIQLWSKLNVKSNWISEWMLMRKAVPDVYT